jgi:flagellar biogenesis protein FliO
LVQVGAQVLVVGVGEGGFTKLGEMAAADLPTLPAPTRPTFASALARALGRAPEASTPSSKDDA